MPRSYATQATRSVFLATAISSGDDGLRNCSMVGRESLRCIATVCAAALSGKVGVGEWAACANAVEAIRSAVGGRNREVGDMLFLEENWKRGIPSGGAKRRSKEVSVKARKHYA